MYLDTAHRIVEENDTPTDVVGSFSAQATSTNNMIGAFGAELVD